MGPEEIRTVETKLKIKNFIQSTIQFLASIDFRPKR